MSSFFSPYGRQFIRVGACVPAVGAGQPSATPQRSRRCSQSAYRARVGTDGVPRYLPVGLCYRRYLVFRTRCSTRSKRQVTHLIDPAGDAVLRCSSSAGVSARRGSSTSSRSAIHRGRGAGRGGQGLSAELPRILRAPPFRLGMGMAGRSIALAGAARRLAPISYSPPAAVRRVSPFMCEIYDRVWVPQGPGAAAARGARSCSICRPATSRWQGADAPAAVRTSQAARCLAACLFGGGVQAKSTTDLASDGQAGDLRAGRGAGRDRAVFGGPPRWPSPTSIVGRNRQERMRTNTFGDCVRAGAGNGGGGTGVPHDELGFRPRTGRADRVCAAMSSAFPMCRPTRRC